MREKLAWAAGFFDGEGSVGNWKSYIYKGRQSYRLRLEISQIDLHVLKRFKDIVGVGNIYGSYIHHKGTRGLPYFRFAASGFEDVQAIAALLWTWLSPIKRQQFAQALQAYEPGRGKKWAKGLTWKQMGRGINEVCVVCQTSAS